MFDTLFIHLEKKVILSHDDKSLLRKFFVPQSLKRKQILLREGQLCRYMSFISRGLIKSYNTDKEGIDHVNFFGWEGWWISDFSSFLTGDNSVLSLETIEDSEILTITLSDYEKMMQSVPIMERYFRILYQNSIITKERRLLSSLSHTAEEKYNMISKQYPELIQRVPQHLIASYLGMAPETISRVKKKFARKK